MTDCKKDECTNSGEVPTNPRSSPSPTDETLPDGQKKDHWILCDEERLKGFIRPIRRSYKHSVCGVTTTMTVKIAETYARDPYFYGSTFCCGCNNYYPVGPNGEFFWSGTSEKVGT